MSMQTKITRITGGGGTQNSKSFPFAFTEADKVGDKITIAHNLNTPYISISLKDDSGYYNTLVIAFKPIDDNSGYFEAPGVIVGTVTGQITGYFNTI